MAYFEDLTPYEYGRAQPQDHILNVGWLSKENCFPKGKLDIGAIEILRVLVSNPINLYRGVHNCEFCPPRIYEKDENMFVGKTVRGCPNGNGEIRVAGKSGVLYVAPTLILHYIENHNYLPPNEFIRAVLKLGAPA